MKSIKSEYTLILEFVCKRLKAPLKSVAFVLYFITIILIIGISANFISLYESFNVKQAIDLKGISLSLVGYGLVLLCSSAIELIFIKFDDEEKDYSGLKNGISMIGISSILFGIIFSILTYFVQNDWFKVSFSSLICLVALFLWWISNSRTLSVLDTPKSPPSTNDSAGGNPEIKEVIGEIPNEFKS